MTIRHHSYLNFEQVLTEKLNENIFVSFSSNKFFGITLKSEIVLTKIIFVKSIIVKTFHNYLTISWLLLIKIL